MSDVEELTIHWEEEGQVMVLERSKRVLQDGSWATILFCYDERDRKTGEMHGPKFAIRRYRSHGGKHHVHSKFVITNEEQARLTADTLLAWLKNPPDAPVPMPEKSDKKTTGDDVTESSLDSAVEKKAKKPEAD